MFEIKADGYAATRPPAELLPIEGGERTFPITLRRDATLGRVQIAFENEGGKRVPFNELQGTPQIARMDSLPIPGGIVIEGGEHLTLTALPAGPYRITVHCAKHAPATLDVTCVAGETVEAVAALKDPAKLRIRFTADEDATVEFQLWKDGRPVPAYREQKDPQAHTEGPLRATGNQGAVFTGLGSGRYQVVVISRNLRATTTAVQLTEGDTAEVEIAVHRR